MSNNASANALFVEEKKVYTDHLARAIFSGRYESCLMSHKKGEIIIGWKNIFGCTFSPLPLFLSFFFTA